MRLLPTELLLVALAGAAGAVARFGVNLGLARVSASQFPYSTLLVNVVGCFAIGVVMHLGLTGRLPPLAVAAIAVGFLGALTTFSAFSYQTLELLENYSYGLALANVAANVLLSLLATWGGLAMARVLFSTE